MDRSIVTVLPGGRITIPTAIRRRLDLQPGDTLLWYLRDGELHFRKAEPDEIEAHGSRSDEETSPPSEPDHRSGKG